MPRARVRLVAVAALVACQPATTRPPFPPAPQAATSEIRLPPGEITRLLAETFRADSIPVRRVEERDAWLETSWFDAASGARVRQRPIGDRAVQVRAWADPTRPGSSKVTVETVYRPVADPSLAERELDRQVPREHPVAIKVRAALQDLVKRFGGPPAPVAPTAEPAADDSPEAAPSDAVPEDESPDTTSDQPPQ
jgi:hypothetical protein